MKIAVWHNTFSGGARRALYDHVAGLVARGHTVESWCPSSATQTYLPLRDLVTEHVLPFEGRDTPPSNPAGKLLWFARRTPQRLRAMEAHCRQCAGEIERGGFDLLFAGMCGYFAVPPIARFLRIPRVIYLQEPYRALYEAQPTAFDREPTLLWAQEVSSGGRFRPQAALYRAIQRRQAPIQAGHELNNIRAFDCILVNSFFSRESVLRTYGLDSQVCYLGVDTQRFRWLDLPRERFVIGLGTITYGKGVDRALRALATLPERTRPDLVWIGNFANGWYADEIKALAQRLGVRFVPRIGITDDELVETLNRASAMLYTSRLEPFGFAPLEANACGTPVVGIAEGGVRETVQDGRNGTLVAHDDSEALGEAVNGFLPPAYVDHAAMRQEVLDRWTWEQASDRLERALLAAVGEAPQKKLRQAVTGGKDASRVSG